MADRVIFMGWDRPTPGKEKKAMKLLQHCMEFIGKLQADGRIESFEPILLSRHGGDLNGMLLIRGDAEKLAELRRDDTWLDLIVAGSACIDSFGVLDGYVGESFNDIMARYAKVLDD